MTLFHLTCSPASHSVPFSSSSQRDRNRPSVIWWSLCNEWGCVQLDDTVTLSIGQEFMSLIKKLDPSRPISGAWADWVRPNGEELGWQWSESNTDIMGYNYEPAEYDKFHEKYPKKPLISSESCSCTSDRSYVINDTETLLGAQHAWSCIKDCWQPVAERSFVMGSFDWTGFDYRGEPTPSSWPATNSHFGVLDLAGFKKDDAYYYQAQFLPDQPLVHITPGAWEESGGARSSGQLLSMDCGADSSAIASLQQWDWANASSSSSSSGSSGSGSSGSDGGGSVIRSRANSAQCLSTATSNYPSLTAPCNTSDPAQLFVLKGDNNDEVVCPAHAGEKDKCLDVAGGTGPAVGFYDCSGAKWQTFGYNKSTGILRELGLDGQCVTYSDGSIRQVWAYTNAESVELFLNGASQGKQTVAKFDKGTYTLPFEPGNLTCVAYDGKGAITAVDTVVTPQDLGTRLELRVDTLSSSAETAKPLLADGIDVAVLTATVLDSGGRIVRGGAANDGLGPEITFAVTGSGARLLGAGNGDPSDHTPEGPTGSASRRAWNGKVRAIVQASQVAGTIQIEASAPGLKGAAVELQAVPPPGAPPTPAPAPPPGPDGPSINGGGVSPGVAAGAACAGVVVVGGAVAIFLWRRRRRRLAENEGPLLGSGSEGWATAGQNI